MIIRYTLFDDDEFGNGAFKRTHQISTILSAVDQELKTVSKYPKKYKGRSFFERMKLGFQYYTFFGIKVFNKHQLEKKAIDIISWKTWLLELKKSEKDLVIVYELSYYSDYSLIFSCYQLGIRIIGLPHNLESLVWHQKSRISNETTPNWFNEEIKLLSLFSKVFTISREEQWLLNLYNINSDYLPYYPSKQVLENCLEIREHRKQTKKDFYLSLGTASNPPTIEGFKEIIHYFKALKLKENLVIAGYETEKLKDFFIDMPSNIKLKGSLDTKELAHVFTNCKALIIFQKPTTGALTKIPEFLLCGIPVICNVVAARNYFEIEGVSVFNSKEELKSILKNKLVISKRLRVPQGYYNNFIQEFDY